MAILGEEVGGADARNEDEVYGSGKGSALVEACRNRDVAMAELLLNSGARDDECRALCVAVRHRDEQLTARLLSMKANADPEHKINRRAMTERTQLGGVLASIATTYTYSSMFPSVPVMINWHNQRCHLAQLRPQWLIDAALHLNARLRQNPRSQDLALYAITRLDVSANSLVCLPLEIFRLTSLRHLNLAQNKIERLPDPAEEDNTKAGKRRSRNLENNSEYRCPVLEELYLQDNRLEDVPEAIFRLPALVTLVLSNNKLQRLPYEIWRAPKLKELNVSFNLLRDLPAERERPPSEDQGRRRTPDRLSVSSSDSQLSVAAECETPRDENGPSGDIIVRYGRRDRCVVQLEPDRPFR